MYQRHKTIGLYSNLRTQSQILCKCKQDSVVSYFLYLDFVYIYTKYFYSVKIDGACRRLFLWEQAGIITFTYVEYTTT